MKAATPLAYRICRLLAVAGALLFASQAQAIAAQLPHEMLSDLSNRAFDVLDQRYNAIDKEPKLLFEVVEEVLLPHVDMTRMSQFVLGKYWRTASKAQQDRFVREFKTLLVRFYVGALLADLKQLRTVLENRDTVISYTPAIIQPGKKLTQVRATVKLPDRPQDIPVIFTLILGDDEWKLLDVKVEGISLVTNYRTSFGTEIQRDGLEAVLDRLTARNEELLANAGKTELADPALKKPAEGQ